MAEQSASEWLEQVYNAESADELTVGYDGWAAQYERDVASYGYTIPAIMTGYVGRYVPADSGPILDAGCGTGLAGSYLQLLGYSDLVGLDMSPGMIEIAKQKGVYKAFHQAVLGDPIDLPDDGFASVVSIGTFTAGHAPASAFTELTRIVRPGGYLIFSLRDDIIDSNGFREQFESLAESGAWRPITASPEFPGLPNEDPDLMHRLFVFQAQ